MTGLLTWGGTHRFRAREFRAPHSVDEVVDTVIAHARVRAIGTRHSFTDVGDTDGVLLSLRGLPQDVEIDHEQMVAWVPSAMTYGELATVLEGTGLALPNLGSLPHISIGGASAIGTHGSGNTNGVLSAHVSGLELVTSDGQVRRILDDDPALRGAVVALGGLGIVIRLRVRLVPAFDVRQDVYPGLPSQALRDSLDAIMAAAYSVSVFLPSWHPDAVAQVWVKSVDVAAPAAAELFGAPRATVPTVPLGDPGDATEQGSVGGWADRLPHTRRSRVFPSGDEIQSEYFVAREHGPAALRELTRVAAAVDGALQCSELRTVAADDLWLSPAYERECLAIHFTWHRRPDDVRRAITAIEHALAPFRPRPHWGKWFGLSPADIDSVTPRAQDFRELRDRFDPRGAFVNEFLHRHLGVRA